MGYNFVDGFINILLPMWMVLNVVKTFAVEYIIKLSIVVAPVFQARGTECWDLFPRP